jgi:uncharacterized MnhB-related membrane protein
MVNNSLLRKNVFLEFVVAFLLSALLSTILSLVALSFYSAMRFGPDVNAEFFALTGAFVGMFVGPAFAVIHIARWRKEKGNARDAFLGAFLGAGFAVAFTIQGAVTLFSFLGLFFVLLLPALGAVLGYHSKEGKKLLKW